MVSTPSERTRHAADLHLVDQLADASPADLVRLATDQLYAGAETDRTDQLTAAATYALVAIADSLDPARHRYAPDLATLRPARDDR